MNAKRILGIVLAVGGIAMFIVSVYITNQVESGKLQIASGQQKVDTANRLFSLDPTTKAVGKRVLTDPAQEQIDEGKDQVAHYEMLAARLKVGGIILFIAGLGFVCWSFKKP